jgi:tetratricopeptide (TPR) repeat protein
MLQQMQQGVCDPPAVDTSVPADQQVAAHIARAKQLISFLRMSQARDALDSAHKLDPTNVEVLKFRARLAATMLDHRTALDDVNAALAIAPKDADLLATRAELRWGNNEFAPALLDAMAAVESDPRDVDARYIKARILMQEDRLRDAVLELDQAIKLEPDFAPTVVLRAQLHWRLKDYNAAIADADQALKLQPGQYSAQEVRALSDFELGKSSDVVADVAAMFGEPGEKRHPPPVTADHQKLMLRRLISLIRLNREAEAQADLDTILNSGQIRSILRLQLLLRRNGFPNTPLDGKRSTDLEDALRACFKWSACWRPFLQS